MGILLLILKIIGILLALIFLLLFAALSLFDLFRLALFSQLYWNTENTQTKRCLFAILNAQINQMPAPMEYCQPCNLLLQSKIGMTAKWAGRTYGGYSHTDRWFE